MASNKKFKEDVEKADKVEKHVANLIMNKEVFVTKGKHNCDIYFNEGGTTKRVEVKSHPASITTGKIAVEFFNYFHWMPTGLSITDADYWVEVFYNEETDEWEVYKYPTDKFKNIVSNGVRRGKIFITRGGDSKVSGIILVYINYLVKASKDYYIGTAPKELFE